jgi:arginine deiminase
MPELKFGVHSEVGKLHKVMVCSPGLAHQRLTPNNCNELLYDDVLWVSQAKRDHFDFVTKMREHNIDVLEMHNLLTDIVSLPEALDWILQRKITANSVPLGLFDEVDAWMRRASWGIQILRYQGKDKKQCRCMALGKL